MKVNLQRFINSKDDAVIIIECQCGNQRMLNEVDNHPRKEIFVYRHGELVKNLRCSVPEDVLIKLKRNGQSICEERYRVTLQPVCQPYRIEVAHVTPRPDDREVETEIISFSS